MNNIFDENYNLSLKNLSCNYAARKEKLKIVEHITFNPIKSRLLRKLHIQEQLKDTAAELGNKVKDIARSIKLTTNKLSQNEQHNKERKEENQTSNPKENQ